MNTQLASILLSRIRTAAFPWLGKTAGLTRPIATRKTGKPEVWPIAQDVLGSLDCEDGKVDAMFPDERYRSILFIECTQWPRRKDERIGQPSWTSTFRVIVWMNCAKLEGIAGCGDVAYQNLVTTLDGYPFNSDPFRFVLIQAVGGGPMRGKEVFGRYTFNEERSQLYHYPFDYFALDLQVDFVLPKGCEDQLTADEVACWFEPVTP